MTKPLVIKKTTDREPAADNKILSKTGAGFTLIELLIGIFIFTLMAVGLIALVSNVLVSSNRQSGLLADSDQARRLSFKVIDELRNAQSGLDGSYPLNLAQDQQIVFFSNADSDIGVERIRYYSQSGKLYKGLTEYNGSIYNTSTEQSVLVQNNLANASTTPVFYYYDDSYTGSSSDISLAQPVDVTDARFIKLNLQIYNKGGVANTNFYTVTTSGAIRGLKTNLGD